MLGYVSIQSFGASTAADTRAALAALDARGAAGYVVDLRANGGGIVSAGTAACLHLTEFFSRPRHVFPVCFWLRQSYPACLLYRACLCRQRLVGRCSLFGFGKVCDAPGSAFYVYGVVQAWALPRRSCQRTAFFATSSTARSLKELP